MHFNQDSSTIIWTGEDIDVWHDYYTYLNLSQNYNSHYILTTKHAYRCDDDHLLDHYMDFK